MLKITIEAEPQEIAMLMIGFVEQFNEDFDVESLKKVIQGFQSFWNGGRDEEFIRQE